ncbi:MAG TPA: glutaredoxin domain-containing protein [Thermoanaerobaculia bacterium]|nr:glutaredoxin domain-containing protein [Thermoanaerobaculia bacterium]
MKNDITVYGADWCGDTVRTLRHLDSKKMEYRYINIDEDEVGEKKVIEFNKGKRRIPMVEVASETLAVPSDAELDRVLVKSSASN